MTDTTTRVLAIIGKRVPAHLGHRLTADAMLSDLHLCPLNHYFSIPCDIEEEFSIELADSAIEAWTCVADVVATVGEMAAVEGNLA